MDNSILSDVKKLLGIMEEDETFDQDILIHINTVIVILDQLGITQDAFDICDEDTTWGELLSDNIKLLTVKSYMYMKVRKMFDPPSSGSASSAMDDLIAELESRIMYEADK